MIALANRRFVFTYFSMVDGADFRDPEGKEAILALAPDLAGSARATPPVFFLAPDGSLLATEDPFCTPEEFLRKAREVLDAHPEYDRPGPGEERAAGAGAAAAIAWARILLETGKGGEARRALAPIAEGDGVAAASRAEALWLLGHEARLAGRPEEAEARFAALEGLPGEARAPFSLDVRLDRALAVVSGKDWAKGLEALKAIDAETPFFARRAELLYAKGLCYYHLGRVPLANYTWIRILEEMPEGRFYQKARLAAMGPGAPSPSPDLFLGGKAPTVLRLPGSENPAKTPAAKAGVGVRRDGLVITEETPERLLQRAYQDYDQLQRRLLRDPERRP